MKTMIFTISLLAALISGNTAAAQTNRKPASAGRPAFIEVEKNVRLHVTDLGEGQPVVLIHGWPLSNEMYEYQYQYLVRRGFRVIGISLRGFGKSDKPYGKYDFDVFSDDINVVLQKLQVKNAVLGGFSMGGAVSLHYVAKYGTAHVSKLALFAAAAPAWVQRPGYPYGISAEAADALYQAILKNRADQVADFGKAFPASETSISANTARWIERMSMETSPYAAAESIASLSKLDLRPSLKNINIPVAVFIGMKDKLVAPELGFLLQKSLPNAYAVRFEESGHALFIEELDKFNTELEKFARTK